MKLFMETTEITDAKTVAAIQQLLATAGATSIRTDYENGRVEALSFCLRVANHDVPFRLPCRWKHIVKLLEQSGKRVRKNDSYEDWGRRVGWRQVLRWIQAQLAFVESEMVKAEEVFLPYAVMQDQKTIYDMFADKQFLLTDEGGKKK